MALSHRACSELPTGVEHGGREGFAIQLSVRFPPGYHSARESHESAAHFGHLGAIPLPLPAHSRELQIALVHCNTNARRYQEELFQN